MKKLVLIFLVLALLLGFGMPRAKAQREFFLVLTVGLKTYVLNGMQLTMDVAPEIVAGRTFVPNKNCCRNIWSRGWLGLEQQKK